MQAEQKRKRYPVSPVDPSWPQPRSSQDHDRRAVNQDAQGDEEREDDAVDDVVGGVDLHDWFPGITNNMSIFVLLGAEGLGDRFLVLNG